MPLYAVKQCFPQAFPPMKKVFLFIFLLFGSSNMALAAEVWLDQYDVSDFASGYGSSRAKQSIMKLPLTVAGVAFARGIGTHAPGTAFFTNESTSALRFSAMVGVDDAASGKGTVMFQIYGDGKQLYDSGIVRQGDKARPVDVDLTGKRLIELKVTDAGDGNSSDHANWCAARFSHEGKAPSLQPRWLVELPHFEGPAPQEPVDNIALSSPSGTVQARAGISNGRLVIAIKRGKTVVLEPSPAGMLVDGMDLGDQAELGSVTHYTTDTTYPAPGAKGTLHDHSNGMKIQVSNKGREKPWTLDVRAYDDGIAWRYLVPGQGTRELKGESTAFVLPEGTTYWSHNNTVTYEANFKPYKATGLQLGNPLTMPLTAELPGGGYACVTEVNMIGYSGMTLGPRGHILTGIYEDDPKGWTLEGDITSPWRVVIAVDDLDGLVNQSIVYNLATPPDPKLFPEGKNEPWIVPGRAYWTWGFAGGAAAHWDRTFAFIDEAAKLNCPYYVIDDPWRNPIAGWHRNGHDEWQSLKEVCDYAATKGVKIMVWETSSRLADKEKREAFFKNAAAAGAVGVKLDHINSESHERLEFFRTYIESAARYHLMVNFHGANKPAGEERTWPNWMTREAIQGMERGSGVSRMNMAALPFTRLVTGPGDTTPTMLREKPMGGTTTGSQLASAVIIDSPIHHWGDGAETYFTQAPEIIQFIKTKPAVWDETRVLAGSKIGDTAIMARRSGSSWWVAAINGTDQTSQHEVKLDFLKAGKWKTVSISDVPGDKMKTDIKHAALNQSDKTTIRMEPGGGFIMMLTPVEK